MTMDTTTLTFEDALQIARGCKDYGSEYRSGDHYEAFQHGIQTVINLLDRTKFSGIKDPQIARIYAIGAEPEPSKPKVLNVNDTVRVKLTDHGRSVHAKEHADFWSNMSVMYGVDRPYTPPKEDAHGWSTSPLWHLMQVFGPQMSPGSTPCFEADIEVVE
jgi:hypothetical protein